MIRCGNSRAMSEKKGTRSAAVAKPVAAPRHVYRFRERKASVTIPVYSRIRASSSVVFSSLSVQTCESSVSAASETRPPTATQPAGVSRALGRMPTPSPRAIAAQIAKPTWWRTTTSHPPPLNARTSTMRVATANANARLACSRRGVPSSLRLLPLPGFATSVDSTTYAAFLSCE